MQKLLTFRYWLEMVSLPVFAYLVVHLGGHGLALFLEGGHDHEIHGGDGLLSLFFTVEVLSGILLLLLFVWLWHRPALKKWVPCSHDHCHHPSPVAHVLAIIALCLHFFPESGVRQALLHEFEGGVTHTFGILGFAAHFLVDFIIAVVISSYWGSRGKAFLSFLCIAGIWGLAFFIGESFHEYIPHESEGLLFLFSAFLLAMFVHWPHKPEISCGTYDH